MRPIGCTLRCCHRCPHGERSGSQHAVMDGPDPVPTHSKQILNDTVNMQESLRLVG